MSVLTNVVPAAEPRHRDVVYATLGERQLRFDIYMPNNRAEHHPLVVWVHGGAWRAGSKQSVPVTELTKHGFAIASVEYRLSPEAKFPAQIHDIKAAIRFLRANAQEYQLDQDSFAIAGASAGGHLAALVGVAGQSLEGDLGAYLKERSGVSAIVSFYGASNLQTILSQSTPHGLSVRVPALQLLLGGQPDDLPDIARSASPVTHVDKQDPPLLLLHGDQDPQMPINQAHELHGVYRHMGNVVEFDVLHGAAHGGDAFYTPERLQRVAEFLSHHLKSRTVSKAK